MNKMNGALGAILAVLLIASGQAVANDCPPLTSAQKAALTKEHLFGGAPSAGKLLVRRGYVTQYDEALRVPRWAAWRVDPDFLRTPEREGKWKSFRPDPEIDNPVLDADYNGLQKKYDYARGHIVPYFISGGDRDGDGKLAARDIDDACTVFEVNYMSNIAPQLHSKFNGAGGLWYQLETIIRQDIAGAGKAIHVIAGTIFGTGDAYVVGPNQDIFVPNMFFQILITRAGTVPFLFVHHERIGRKGCALTAQLEECIVSIADIEEISGLNFFSGLTKTDEIWFEKSDGRAVWAELIGRDVDEGETIVASRGIKRVN